MIEKVTDWHAFTFGKAFEDRDAQLVERLRFPNREIDVVLDTDTYNEIDDQFAMAYLLKNGQKLHTKALYAAPFYNDKSEGPADGMEKSYQEIRNLLMLMDRQDLLPVTFRGSDRYLPDEQTPVVSDAAQDLARRAMEYTPDNPLYVVAIGAITNVASALLIQPEIRDRIVVVWLGGNSHHWVNNNEFNSYQDVAAVRVVFNAGLALVHLPCMGVVSSFIVSKFDFIHNLTGKNKLCDYLLKHTVEVADRESPYETWSRIVWDVTTIGWLLNEDFMVSSLEHTPLPQYDNTYSFNCQRPLYRYVFHINRDALLNDLFASLTR